MSNPTSNYSWQMPTSSDLVTDLPADFEVFGQAVDTQVYNNAQAAIAKTLIDAKGDLIVGSAADTAARLAVGTNGQVLMADSTAGDGIKWGDVAAGSNWSLLNSGSTALSGTTKTISGISGKDKIMVLLENAYASTNNAISIRFNGDTGTNYYYYGIDNSPTSGYSASIIGNIGASNTYFTMGYSNADANSKIFGALFLSGGNSSGVKAIQCSSGANRGTAGYSQHQYVLGGYWNSTSTITSVSVYADGNTLQTGNVYVYASA